jgi:branched-chain amino acid transport system permease protein
VFWINLPLAGVAAAFCAVLFGPVLRLRGHFLAMATIAFGEIVRIILLTWDPVTNGPRGIIGIPHPKIINFTFSTDARYYYIILASVAISFLIVNLIIHSRTGRALRAIRDDQDAAWTCGISITYYKTLVFALGGFFSGIAGSLYAHLTGYISPDLATFSQSVQILVMVVVGGIGLIAGSALGAVAMVVVPEYLRIFQHFRLIVYSVVLLLMIIYAPKGLAGLLGSLSKTFNNKAKLFLEKRKLETVGEKKS